MSNEKPDTYLKQLADEADMAGTYLSGVSGKTAEDKTSMATARAKCPKCGELAEQDANGRDFCRECYPSGDGSESAGLRESEPPIVCNVCKAIFVLSDDREHLCGLTLPEAYSLGWRRGNNLAGKGE